MLSSIGSRVAADPEELHFRREARSRFVRTFLRYPAALPALILFVIVACISGIQVYLTKKKEVEA